MMVDVVGEVGGLCRRKLYWEKLDDALGKECRWTRPCEVVMTCV